MSATMTNSSDTILDPYSEKYGYYKQIKYTTAISRLALARNEHGTSSCVVKTTSEALSTPKLGSHSLAPSSPAVILPASDRKIVWEAKNHSQ